MIRNFGFQPTLQKKGGLLMKVLTIILGVLVLIGGIVCLFMPGASFGALSVVIGVIVLLAGIALIANYAVNRKLKTVTGWDLFGGIITLLLGILLVFNTFANHVLDVIIVYLFGSGVLIAGIVRVVMSIRLRKLSSGKMWIWTLILGILVAILGVYFLFHPILAGLTIGYMVAFYVIICGVDMLAAGIAMRKAE